jgi:hypothetical protein
MSDLSVLCMSWFQRDPGGTTVYVAPVADCESETDPGGGGYLAPDGELLS